MERKDIDCFVEIQNKQKETYVAKNSDYGSSYTKTVERYGYPAIMIPLHNKVDRLESLVTSGKNNVGESIEDSLLDLANYAILALIEIRQGRV